MNRSFDSRFDLGNIAHMRERERLKAKVYHANEGGWSIARAAETSGHRNQETENPDLFIGRLANNRWSKIMSIGDNKFEKQW